MKYTDKERKVIMEYKSEIIDACKKCDGTGYDKNEDKCECLHIFNYVKELIRSNIQNDYWDKLFTTTDIDASALIIAERYVKNLKTAVKKKMGFVFLGENGIGKTTLMNIIGMSAIIKQYRIFYIRVKEVLDNIFEKDDIIKNRIEEADIILLDELDKIYQKGDWATHNIDDFLRRYLKDKSIIIASNWSEEEIKENFGSSIYSLLNGYNKFINMTGKDYRKKQNKDWMKRLSDAESIDMKKLKKPSQNWQKNKLLKLAKTYDIIVK